MWVVPFSAIFCTSYWLGFPGIISNSFLRFSSIISSAPTIIGVVFTSTFHILLTSICKSLYLRIFSFSFFITFWSLGMDEMLYQRIVVWERSMIGTSTNLLIPFKRNRDVPNPNRMRLWRHSNTSCMYQYLAEDWIISWNELCVTP